MKKYIFLLKEISRGKSVLRAYMNFHMKEVVLVGRTIDVGSGSGWVRASDALKKSDSFSLYEMDNKIGASVDFEKDKLPFDDSSFDTVLFLNVMEHIFNYQHISDQLLRITKPGGKLLGYVPFLMWYHQTIQISLDIQMRQ